MSSSPDVSVLILTRNEEGNIGPLLKEVRGILSELAVAFEMIVVDGGSIDKTVAEAKRAGANCVLQTEKSYASALRQGLRMTKGNYVLTLDADQSHPAGLIRELWRHRGRADLLIASRFIPGGDSKTSWLRTCLSRILNAVFSKVLHIPVSDFSSGYRLYRRSLLTPGRYFSKHFDILPEILVKAYAAGYSAHEIPLKYRPRRKGKSSADIVRFGLAFFGTLARMWVLRNSIESADYDHRAYDSPIFLQRYWQRKRHEIIRNYIDRSKKILDIGCGSSRIIQDLPEAVALDVAVHKLRFLKKTNRFRVQASTFHLPFAAQSFEQAIHSQVIEHIPFDAVIYRELERVLSPGGVLVIGTPDYGRIWWPLIEFFYDKLLPNAYAHEHITHYTKRSLVEVLEKHGFKVLDHRYICGGELIIKARKVRRV